MQSTTEPESSPFVGSDPTIPASTLSKWHSTFTRLNQNEPAISGLLAFTEAWRTAREFLWPRDIREEARKHDMTTVKAAFTLLNQGHMLPRFLDTFVEDMRHQAVLIVDDINEFMGRYEATQDVEVIKQMISRLVDWRNAWMPIQELGATLIATFTMEFQKHLFSSLPPSFPPAYKKLCQSTVGAPIDLKLWGDFERLGLLDRFESLIASVGYEQIEGRIADTCPGNWSEPMLKGLRDWSSQKIVPWMVLPFARGARTNEETRAMLSGIGARFDYHLCKSLCDLRISEIFDIIVDYPDSENSLTDLKECLLRVDARSKLVQALRRQNAKRLLHPGADTKDILAQYVSMIRCLRIIDPPGVLLHKVADPVRRYLRGRSNTIRSIVSSLVGEGGDLVDENEPIQPLEPLYEDYTDPNWEPEAIDAGPDFRTKKPSDVISTLVSIYDSKDLFVKELQVLLAQRLLAVKDGNYEKERRNIEILKLRFGDAALQVCEVMLKDMTDSRRVDQHVQSQKPSVLHPTIISKHFWPALHSSHLQMPGQFRRMLEEYSKEYVAFKPDKRLRWMSQLGTVELSVELRDRVLEVEVPALEAAIIELFSHEDEWSTEDIMRALGGVDYARVLKALTTWIDHGVLRETQKNIFILIEVADGADADARPTAPRHVTTEEPASPVVSVQQQEAEQMRVHWKFIEGMLTNLGSLPIDRIQTMLKFAPNYTQSVDQLTLFMEAARREGLVTVNSGLWKLNK